MKVLNVSLAVVVSLLLAVGLLELGLRALGFGPPNTGLRFDARLGWALQQDHRSTHRGREFEVEIETDAHGLRDDYHGDVTKPEGVYRIVCLGDSFTLGYTVDRSDLFVDLLERWWTLEGRRVEVVNAGVQGYSTDQEVAWLIEHVDEWSPDLVLVLPYENDLFWNTKDRYAGAFKPVFDDRGALITGQLEDRLTRTGLQRTALGRALFEPKPRFERYNVIGAGRSIDAAFVPLLTEPPPSVLPMERRTAAILHGARHELQKRKIKLAVCLIPSHAQVDPEYANEVLGDEVLRLPRERFDPNLPYQMLERAAQSGADWVLDPLSALRASQAAGEAPYYRHDPHLSPAGNRALAGFLHSELDRLTLVPPTQKPARLQDVQQARPRSLPAWTLWFAGLWAVLGLAYSQTYRDEPRGRAFAQVGLLLAAVFGLVLGASALRGALPGWLGRVLFTTLALGFLVFCTVRLWDRLGTIFETLVAFGKRGHWYLLPALAVLLALGSLLVVAATTPWIAPFVYTLF